MALDRLVRVVENYKTKAIIALHFEIDHSVHVFVSYTRNNLHLFLKFFN